VGLGERRSRLLGVGRGAAESTCVLLFEQPVGDVAKQRLKVIFENNDGFEIARQDLSIRGPGNANRNTRFTIAGTALPCSFRITPSLL